MHLANPLALRRPWRRTLARGAVLAGLVLSGQGMAWEPQTFLDAAHTRGPATEALAQTLTQLIAQASTLPERERLQLVNDFFNRRIRYVEDIEVWGQRDHWASPLEMLDKGRGDCEDYAMAKYFSLMAAGVSEAKMRMVYVRAVMGTRSFAHMVLAYYAEPTAEPLILDNLRPRIELASRRMDLAPVFSFNAEGMWTEGAGARATPAGDPLARLSRWRDVLSKAREEGWWTYVGK